MLTNGDKLKYLHNLFKDDELIFHHIEIEGKYFELEDALNRIERESNPISRQQQAYREPHASQIETLKENTTSRTEALNELNPYILSHFQPVLPRHRNEDTKTTFLKGAINGFNLAM